jgi:hypothetical protein
MPQERDAFRHRMRLVPTDGPRFIQGYKLLMLEVLGEQEDHITSSRILSLFNWHWDTTDTKCNLNGLDGKLVLTQVRERARPDEPAEGWPT